MRAILNTLIGLMCCLLLASCHQDEQPLRIGGNIWIGYEPLFMARGLNLLSEKNARLVEYTSASQVISAFKDGAIDGAMLTMDEVLLLQQSGVNIKVVLQMDYSDGADAILARPRISNMPLLKGHRVGVEDSALGAFVLFRALEQAGMSSSDVQIVPVDVSQHENAFKTGEVDAIVTFEPVKSKLLAAGANSIFTSKQIPHEIADVLVVRGDLDERQIVQLKSVISAWFKALDYLKMNQADALQRMRPRMELDTYGVMNMLQQIKLPNALENRAELMNSPSIMAIFANKLAAVMVEHGLAQPGLHPEQLIDSDLLKKLYP